MKKNIVYMLPLMAVMMVMMACSSKPGEVSDAVASIKVPYEMMDGFTVNTFQSNDTAFVAECTISDPYMAEVFTNAEYMMVNINNAAKHDDFKLVRAAMADNDMKMTVVAKNVAGELVNKLTMTAEQFGGKLDKAMVVRATAAAENAGCPMDMDDGRKLLSAKAQGDDTVVYTMECGENYRSTDFVSIEDAMKRAMINSMADAAGKRERNAMGIYYKYIYKIGGDTLHVLTITPHDWLLY